MKKQLLLGAMLLGTFMAANAQSSCNDAAVLPVGTTPTTTTVAAPAGEYVSNCFATQTDDAADAAEWYMVTATENGVIRVNTNLPANEGGDTRIAVYSGTCDDLTCWYTGDDVFYNVIEDENGDPMLDPESILLTDIQFPVLAGETYYITFDNQWMAEGFDVELTFMAPGCSSTTFNENWENSASYYFCWTKIDNNEDENGWSLFTDYGFDSDDVNPDNTVAIFAGEEGNDDYLISNAKNLIGGNEYTFHITYNGVDSTTASANESFEVVMFQTDSEDQFVPVEAIGGEEGVTMNGAALNELRDGATEGEYTFTPETDGQYYMAIHSISEAGGGALLIFEVTIEGVMSTNNVLAKQLSVYPNPATNVINISNADNILVNGVQIVDLNGRTVKSMNFDGVTEAQVNVSDLANGMYMMTVSSDKGTMTQKIVKN